MRVLKVTADNFASYVKLDFDFTNQGLTLIQGANGAGKSTLCDLIPWALFGQTAKGGAVSEVLSWPGDKTTKVILEMENITIMRTRGKPNDLYWDLGGGPQRGKDLPDTQRRIEALLGFTYETYMAGAYYHEFSQTAQFFNTTAKNRRLITEELVDLSLATHLQFVALGAKKALLSEMPLNELTKVATKLEVTASARERANARMLAWEAAHNAGTDKFERDREIDLNEARRAIQVQKSMIRPLPDTDLYPKCPTCDQPVDHEGLHEVRSQDIVNNKAAQRIEILSEKIKEIKLRKSPHIGENPHAVEANELFSEITSLFATKVNLEDRINRLKSEAEDLELLGEVLENYRSVSITNAISGLQDTTNTLLSDHFDAELRVVFSAQDADKIDIEITKDGNQCSYTQLSKGQRCILKLCFGVAVMNTVATTNAIQFPQIFLDEALDGLSDTFKHRAFGLLQKLALSKESVMVVEHSEAFKSLFDSVYNVTLVNGESQIAKA